MHGFSLKQTHESTLHIIHRDLNNCEDSFRSSGNNSIDQMVYANCTIKQFIELQV